MASRLTIVLPKSHRSAALAVNVVIVSPAVSSRSPDRAKPTPDVARPNLIAPAVLFTYNDSLACNGSWLNGTAIDAGPISISWVTIVYGV